MINDLLDLINSETIYLVANWGVIPFWLLLIIFPNHGITNFFAQSIIAPLLLAIAYGYLSYNLYLDNDLLLLIKTLIHIEGMGRQIYPELDFWSVANPFLKTWFKDKYSVKGLVKYLVSKKHILTYMIVKRFEETQEIFDQNYGDIK